MKVKYKKYNTILFTSIKIGDCFKYGDDLYIKIRSSSSDYNSFNVYKESVETIYQNTNVIPVNMVLVEE